MTHILLAALALAIIQPCRYIARPRQKVAREFGATEIVTERGDEGVARIKELTNDIGADAVLECVGPQESMMQAIRAIRPDGSVGYVGVPHGVELNGEGLFFTTSISMVAPRRCAASCPS